jgi:hypothetical protein
MLNLSLFSEYIIYVFAYDSVVEYVLIYQLYPDLYHFITQVPGFKIHHAIFAPSLVNSPVSRHK